REEVGDVVAVVASRRRLERGEPERVDAQALEIVEPATEPFEIAAAVAVAVHERLDVEAVDDGVLVPEVAGHAVLLLSEGMASYPTIAEAAEKLFGFTTLRPGQEDAVRAALDGHDTLAVMPTGSGKSAIYELATAIGGGPAVVVSPLLALQRDQVEAIERN